MRCAVYVRVNTDDQRDNGYSIDSQLRMIKEYCEPIIDETTWNATRNVLVKNKHSNYGEFIHLFSGLVKCPICGSIMASSESFKYTNGKQKVYYHLRCKNHNCSGFLQYYIQYYFQNNIY